MTHIRVDNTCYNSKRKFACGIGPDLPPGDVYFYEAEVGMHHKVDCPGCMPNRVQLGTPISQLSGRPGTPGFDKFSGIARSWGYD